MATPIDPAPQKKPGSTPPPGGKAPAPGTPPGSKPPAPAGGVKPAPSGSPPPKAPAQGGAPAPRPPAQSVTSGPGKTPGATPPKPAAPGAKPPAGGVTTPAGGAKAPPGKPGEGKPGAPAPKPAKKPRATGRRKLEQVLVDLGFIDEDQLWDLGDESKATGKTIGEAAVARGLITDDQLLQALGELNGLKVVTNPADLKPTAEALALVPETMATVYKILPLTYRDKVLTVALSDPNHLPALDDLRNMLGITEVVANLAPAAAMNEVLAKCYLGKEQTIMEVIAEIETDTTVGGRQLEVSVDIGSEEAYVDAAPVRKLINMVFLLAIKDKASDIHFEPFEDEYKMRYRADGVLYEMVPPPRHLATAISSRIKVMANLDIAERRLPQDGRIELNVGGNRIDLRVSILPTMFGESAVIRVLDRTVVSLDLNKIGMPADMLVTFRQLIAKPNGILLVTGPTGSGKTTTLYSALNELNVITDKIITTEDPVEYDIDGIIQVPINHEIGLTFAAALRSILRQDPDKILVGEIRDLETAQIAVQAALTGHMVFSTLHTNDAPSTITRMRDMGLETFLITATVEAILAQRLVRKICSECRTEFDPSREMLMELNLTPDMVKGKQFYYGRGCERCNNSGHKGRTGLYELLIINDDVRDMITNGTSIDEMRERCIRMGMSTLRDSGLAALYAGHTTIDEVVRETILES
jgi:type IV pilus assembly protein PilB